MVVAEGADDFLVKQELNSAVCTLLGSRTPGPDSETQIIGMLGFGGKGMKRKQVIVLGLVLVIIAVGILQYNSGGVGDAGDLTGAGVLFTADGSEEPEDIPGAAVYVKGEDELDQAMEASIDASSDIYSGYFAEARLERDKARSRQKEELRSLAESGDTIMPLPCKPRRNWWM